MNAHQTAKTAALSLVVTLLLMTAWVAAAATIDRGPAPTVTASAAAPAFLLIEGESHGGNIG